MAPPSPTLLRRLLWVLIPVSVAVAVYCYTAATASGGSYRDREGEYHYSSPVRYSREFYVGLRWSVTGMGAIVGSLAVWCRRRTVATVFFATAFLFNPIVPVRMARGAWEIVDAAAGWVFLVGPAYLWPKDERAA